MALRVRLLKPLSLALSLLFISSGELFSLSQASAENLRDLYVEQSGVHVTIETSGIDAGDAAVKQYVADGVRAAVTYYRNFPVKNVLIRVEATEDDTVGFATATHDDDGSYGLIEIDIGRHVSRSQLDKSWTLTHELMHLAFPVMPRQRRWLAEGVATYIEPIARIRTGKVRAEQFWGELYDNSWRADRRRESLNETSSLSRIYWGGAMYCLVADLRVRRRTHNRVGLEDALRSVAAGGGAASQWSAEKTIEVMDRSVAGNEFSTLYREMAVDGGGIDLTALWRSLGVSRVAGRLVLDETAPLAALRHAIEGRD